VEESFWMMRLPLKNINAHHAAKIFL